jgi:hypothetical protein
LEPATHVTIRFVTPIELKSGQRIVGRPEFSVLFARLRDRISTLRLLYGAGPLVIDFQAMARRAGAVRITRCMLRKTEAVRRSSRSGQRHALGGLVGEACFEGPIGEFLPYLRLGKWVGVGRHTVWGNGEMEVVSVQTPQE